MTIKSIIFTVIGAICLLASVVLLIYMLNHIKRAFGNEIRNEPNEKEEDLKELK